MFMETTCRFYVVTRKESNGKARSTISLKKVSWMKIWYVGISDTPLCTAQ